MRGLLLVSCVLISLLVSNVNCQKDESEPTLWQRLANTIRDFMDKMKGYWSEMKEEIKARTQDFGSWTAETWDEFKGRMKNWINKSGADDTEKEDMRNYIERLQMPEEEKKSE